MNRFWLLEYETVLTVKDIGLDRDRVLFAVDTPLNGERFLNHMVEIAGWLASLEDAYSITRMKFAIGDRSFEEVIDFLPRPDVRAAVLSGYGKTVSLNCGFDVSLPSYLATEHSPILVSYFVSEGDSTREVLLCSLTFRISRKTSIGDVGFTPVVVTSHGRSGSTILCRALARHPFASLSGTLYNPGEFRFLEHFLMSLVIQTGQSPGDRLNLPSLYGDLGVLNKPPFSSPSLLFDSDHAHLRSYVCDAFPRAYQESLLPILASYFVGCHRRNDRYPTHVIEKSWNAIGIQLGHLAIEGFREVILLRDFNDNLSSRIKFLRKINRSDLIARDAHWLADNLTNLIQSIKFRGGSAAIVRYAELVGGDYVVLSRILDYLALERNPGIVAKMSSAILDRGSEFQRHSTQGCELTKPDEMLIERISSEYSSEIEAFQSLM